MNDTIPSRQKRPSTHRLTLLATAASIAAAAVITAPSGKGVLNALIMPARAAGETHAPAGFADVVAKVKPAVISVKVKVEQRAQNDGHAGGRRVVRRFRFCRETRSRNISSSWPGFRGMPNGMPHGKADGRQVKALASSSRRTAMR